MDPLLGEETFTSPQKSFPCVSNIGRSRHPRESYGVAAVRIPRTHAGAGDCTTS
jgi:hypothetical protein